MERELKGMERTILISNDIRPFNFQAVRTAITSLQIPLTPKKINYQLSIINSQLTKMKLSPSTIEALIIILREIITLLLNAKKKNKKHGNKSMEEEGDSDE